LLVAYQEVDLRVAFPLGVLNGSFNFGMASGIILPLVRNAQDLLYHFQKDFTWMVTGFLFATWVDHHHFQASKQKV
jgi:hypothetical protein